MGRLPDLLLSDLMSEGALRSHWRSRSDSLAVHWQLSIDACLWLLKVLERHIEEFFLGIRTHHVTLVRRVLGNLLLLHRSFLSAHD